MIKQQIIITTTFFLLTVSCMNSEDTTVVASVYEKELTLETVMTNIPQQTEDTTFFLDNYINAWIKKQLLLYHAEINISSDVADYEQQIDDYKSSLLIYAYQQELINQKFDTTVSEQSIQDYYAQYKDGFKLNKNIFKGKYVVVDKKAPKLNQFKRLFYATNADKIEDLTEYCQQFAKEFFLQDNRWIYFSDINKELPKEIEDEVHFLRHTKRASFEDETYKYFIFVADYQILGNISPLSLEHDKIKSILLNKNKVNYLRQLEDELYQDALTSKNIKIY